MKPYLFIVLFLLPIGIAFSQIVDVDHYSGKASVTIPLYDIKSGSLSSPVLIYYNTGGIKADNYGGPMGTGWNIVAGGSISRELRGLPDDYSHAATTNNPAKKGWLVNNTCATIGGFVPAADNNLNDCTDEETDFNFLNSLGGFSGGTIFDTEPDIYNINVPGLSGSFTFNNAGQVAFLTKQDYVVTYSSDANGFINSFLIVDHNGITYTFGKPEISNSHSFFNVPDNGGSNTPALEAAITHLKYQYYLYKGGMSYNSEWKLLSIESTNHEKISFEYAPRPVPLISLNSDFTLLLRVKKIDDVYANGKLQYSISRSVRNASQFTSATTKLERIEVTNASLVVPEGEYFQKQSLATGVSVYDITKSLPVQIKKYDFNYESVQDEGDAFYFLLRSVVETSGIRTQPPYVFDYFGVDFTTKTLQRPAYRDEFDFLNFKSFGYDDGPYKTFVYPALTGIDKFRNKPLLSYSGDHYETEGKLSEADLASLLAVNLKQINLPGGGSNRIYYEPVIYRDNTAQSDFYGGGLRVKSVEYHDGVSHANDISTNYKYENEDGTSSGVLLYRPLRAFSLNASINSSTGSTTYYHELVNQGLSQEQISMRTTVTVKGKALNESSDPGTCVGYKRVTVSQPGAGKTVYEYDIAAPYGAQSETGWTATVNKIAREKPITGFNIVAHNPGPIVGSYAYPFAPNPNYDYKRGLLKKIAAYNNAGNLVKQTENEYTFLTNPAKVYALKMDQYKALLTYNRPGPGQTGTITMTSAVPMFIYNRYELNTNTRPRLLRTTNKTYDQNSSSVFSTDVQTYEHGSAAHDLVTKALQTGSDGIEYATNYKYAADYTVTGAWNQQDNLTKAITKLKTKNIVIPIETIQTKKEGTESPAVIGASLNIFEYAEGPDNIYLRKSYSLQQRDPVTNFTPSSVNNSGGASSFIFENTKYNNSVDYLNQDGVGNAESTVTSVKTKSSIHTDSKTGITKAAIANALANEVAFSDFESASRFDFVYSNNNVSATGRTAGSALNLTVGPAQLSRPLTKGDGSSYTFSCWIKSASSGSLTIRVTDGVHAPISSAIPFVSTASTWKYYSTSLVTSSFNSVITASLETNTPISVDDVLFYPSSAAVKTFLYGKGFTTISETDSRGMSTFFEYDDFGRILFIRDQDQNIIKTNNYQVSGARLLNYGSLLDQEAYTNESKILTLVTSLAYPGATYKWKIVKHSDHVSNPALINDFSNAITVSGSNQLTYTFTQTGPWLINVQITYQGLTTTIQDIQTVQVLGRPLQVSLCSNRPSDIDLCRPVPLISGCSLQTSDMVLKATVTGGSGSFSYVWQSREYVLIHQEITYSSTGSTLAIPDGNYSIDLIYTCTVTDLNTNSSIVTDFYVRTYRSDPNCPSIPAGN